jgi:hypothetical protein
MMQSNLQRAFRIEVFHSYFEGDVCKCLQFKPGVVTRKLLNRFDLTIRNHINGFDFYVNSRNSLSEFLSYLENVTTEICFDFEIETNNPKFFLFTDLPTDWMGELIYSSKATIEDGDKLLLTESLSIHKSSACLGKLTMNFEDILKFQNDKGYAKFDIRLSARSTQWQYFVINKSLIQLNNPAISAKTNIDFDGPENVFIESGQAALLFSSGKTLIPLSEKPKYKFDLINNPPLSSSETIRKIPAPKIIWKGLPNPDPKRFGISKVNKENLVSSPMYVYI